MSSHGQTPPEQVNAGRHAQVSLTRSVLLRPGASLALSPPCSLLSMLLPSGRQAVFAWRIRSTCEGHCSAVSKPECALWGPPGRTEGGRAGRGVSMPRPAVPSASFLFLIKTRRCTQLPAKERSFFTQNMRLQNQLFPVVPLGLLGRRDNPTCGRKSSRRDQARECQNLGTEAELRADLGGPGPGATLTELLKCPGGHGHSPPALTQKLISQLSSHPLQPQ